VEEWLSFRDEFFDELHRIDGRGDYRRTSTCNDCKEDPGLYHFGSSHILDCIEISKDQQQRKFGDE
jgi:hypothetical protein